MNHPSQALEESIASLGEGSKRPPRRPRGWAPLLVAAGLCVAGCAVDAGDLDLLIVRSSIVQEEPLDPDLVTWLRVRVEGPTMGVRMVEEPFVRGATTRLPGVPVGPDRVFQIEGWAGEEGPLVSRGESVPVSVTGGGMELELYVGLAGRFSSSGGTPLLDPRGEARLVAATPGALFLVGGRTAPGGAWVGAVETFDPGAGKIRLSGDCRGAGFLCLRAPRSEHAALGIDGAVLVLGGRGPEGLVTTVERCSEAGCSKRGSLPAGRAAMAVAPHPEGGGFVVGGEGEAGALAEVGPPLPEPRMEAAAGIAGDGSLVVAGGEDGGGTLLAPVLRLAPGASSFESVAGFVAEPRRGARALTLSDGRLLFVGGLRSDGTPSDEIDLFDPQTGRICPVGRLRLPLADHSASSLHHRQALVAGGRGPGRAVTGEVTRLDARFVPAAVRCEVVEGTLEVAPAGRLRHPRWGHAAASTVNGLVIVAGGYDPDGSAVATLEIYVP